MLQKIQNKLANMTAKNWIVASSWLTTFVLLLAFVIYDAIELGNGASGASFANTTAALGLVFALVLFGSLIVTVVFAYQKKKAGK